MIKFYKATLETRHFSFEAFGEDDLAALAALNEGIAIHCKQVKIDLATFTKDHPDIHVGPWLMGRAYRDGEPLA